MTPDDDNVETVHGFGADGPGDRPRVSGMGALLPLLGLPVAAALQASAGDDQAAGADRHAGRQVI
jgi:hypothetical protein